MNDTERRLVVDLNRWRKDRGWFDTNLGWVDANHTTRIRPTISGFDLWERTEGGNWQLDPDHYWAPTLRSAVDTLVALGVLPDDFNSIKRAVVKAFEALIDDLESEGSTDQLDSAYRIRLVLDGEYPTGGAR